MRVLITSNGCVSPVARSPAVAPEVIESRGPDEGEFNGEAAFQLESQQKNYLLEEP